MYQRDIPWEMYLQRYGWKEDANRGLLRISPPPLSRASYADLIASVDETRSVLERSLESVDVRTITPESLRAAFDWAMGSLLWRQELTRPGLLEQAAPFRIKTDPIAMEARVRAERAYLNGAYAEALKGYLSCEAAYPQDFTLSLSLGHLYLYHQRPPELIQAGTYYMRAARQATPRAPLYAGRALLFAALVAYLQNDPQAALERARQAAQSAPSWPETWFSQARYAALCTQPDLALPALEQAVRMDRNYALRAGVCPDFAPLEGQVTGLLERLCDEVRLQAEAQGRSINAEITVSPIPAEDTPTTQRMQAEIAERWKQATYFGYLDAAGKMMRFKVYLEGLHLAERDGVIRELTPIYNELHAGLEQQASVLGAGLQGQLKEKLAAAEAALAVPPTLEQARAALEQIRKAQSLWTLATSQTTLTGHTGAINLLAFSPDGRWLVSSGSWDLSLRLWDSHSGELAALLNGHYEIIRALAFTPDGSTLISAGGDYKGRDFSIRLWDIAARRTRRVIEGHTNQVTALAVQPSGQLLASASSDFSVRLWSLPSGDRALALEGEHTAGVTCLAWTPDGSLLLSGGEDLTIRIWDAASGTQVGLLLGHEAPLARLLVTPDGKTLISQADDQTLRLWDLPNRQLLSVHDQPAGVNAMVLNRDGTRLAWAAGVDGLVRLWTPGSPEPPQELSGHTGRVSALAFSAEGQLLASGGEDNQVRLWDPASGSGKAIRRGHTGQVNCLAFSPDAALLASGSVDQNVHLWGLVLSEADARAVAEEAQARTLQAEEERQARLAEQERQRQAWRAAGRCEICGVKLGLLDKLTNQSRCKEHRRPDSLV